VALGAVMAARVGGGSRRRLARRGARRGGARLGGSSLGGGNKWRKRQRSAWRRLGVASAAHLAGGSAAWRSARLVAAASLSAARGRARLGVSSSRGA